MTGEDFKNKIQLEKLNVVAQKGRLERGYTTD